MRDRSKEMSEVRSLVTGRIVDSYTNILTVKLFSRPWQEDAYVREAVDDHTGKFHASLRLNTLLGLSLSSLNALMVTGTGALLAQETHSFLKVGLGAEYRTCFGSFSTGNEKWDSAKEYRSVTQTGTGTVITWRNWEQRSPVVWANDVGWSDNEYARLRGQDQPQNDERVTWEETTLEDGKVKRVEYGYDQFNNVTSIKEYDFGTAGSPGTLSRQTVRTYGANIGGNYGISINGYCYSNLNPTDSTCGGGLATDVTSIIYQPGLLLNETVEDAGGTPKAYSELEYDNYTPALPHAAIVENGGMIQYDGSRFSTLQPSTLPRGNVTKVTRWLNGGTDVVAFSHYDNAGQVVWSKDPNGNVSTASYADNFGAGDSPDSGVGGPNGATYALASLATNAAGHVVKMQYNYSLGAATGVKDPNGVITKTEYDSLGRPFRVTSALGLAEQSVSEMSYPTEAANEARVSKQLDANRWLSSRTSFDGFDRPVLAATAEDGLYYSSANYTIFSKTVYDPLGRAKLVTNPYRAVAAATDGWSRSSYDLGGRVTEVATFAGGVANQPPDTGTNANWTGSVTSVYASEVTTVTDQAGKKRQSVTDALGRLKEVYEAPNDSSYNFLTSYSYDTLDNLTLVTQGTQTPRTFVYDSLKRLKSATNPESGTICYGTVNVSGLCQADGYDPNGNLIYKTDARGVQSHYAYDALNRNTSVTYSNDPAATPTVTRIYDGATNGIGRLWKAETGGANGSSTTINSFDALGRPLSESQQFYSGTQWSQPFTTQRTYNRAGGITSQIYPSNHTVIYNYDAAGRLGDKDAQNLAFKGNLGDGGATRTYSQAITYSPFGGIAQEQFGTDTAIYNKLAYNSRGQLAEIKESTAPNDSSWNRGKFVNWYSLGCGGAACNATDNNGNLRKQETLIPNNEQNTSSTSWYQQYDYDSLNRLQRVHEYTGNTALDWQQEYVYDRYGNRTIHQTNTWGAGINKKDFTANVANDNRLGVPTSSTGRMDYDSAGNLVNDTYTSYGRTDGIPTRLYDAENRLTTAKDGNLQVVSSYTYNADGQRVRRKVNGVETWQVYGIDGELLAEYAANAGPVSPQKENGYRNGQLLISADASALPAVPVFSDNFNDNSLDATKWTVVDAGSSAAVSEQSQQLRITLLPNTAAYNGVYSNSTFDMRGKTVQVEVPQAVSQGGWSQNYLQVMLDSQNYYLINVGSGSFVFRSMVNGVNNETVIGYDPTALPYWRIRHEQTANTVSFETSTNGVNWTTRKTVTAAFSLTAVRFYLMAGAWGTGNGSPGAAKYDNFQLAESGAAPAPVTNLALNKPATQISTYSTAVAGLAVDGNTNGNFNGNSVTHTATGTQDWWQVDLGSSYALETIKVWNRTDCCGERLSNFYVFVSDQPFSSYDLNTTLNQAGVSNYYTAGQGGTPTYISANRTGRYVRVQFATAGMPLSLAEVEVMGSTIALANINWLVTDQLGTPRMIFDKTGALANVKRHDYLPFGEELSSVVGLRSSSQGYGAADGVRQKFTQKERDIETGLDYFGARYYGSIQGRFTGADPAAITEKQLVNPQDLNRYAYVANNPLKFIDPDGEEKILVVITTFIPDKSATAAGRTFEGDGRNVGEPGGFRTQQSVTIETDPSRGAEQAGPFNHDTGISQELSGPGGSPIGQSAQASGETLEGRVTRYESGVVNIQAKGNEGNPLVSLAPGITYDFNIKVQSAGTQGNVTITVTGSHDQFPAYEISVTRPEVSKPTTTTVYSYDPRQAGTNSPYNLIPGHTQTINPPRTTVIAPPPPPPPPERKHGKRGDD